MTDQPPNTDESPIVNPLNMLDQLKRVLTGIPEAPTAQPDGGNGSIKQEEDEVDIRYALNGKHYGQYRDAKKLVAESNVKLNEALEEMDQGILSRIRENETEYHQAVMKYLHDKEEELRTVLRRLD